jgi:hypothetical protein
MPGRGATGCYGGGGCIARGRQKPRGIASERKKKARENPSQPPRSVAGGRTACAQGAAQEGGGGSVSEYSRTGN